MLGIVNKLCWTKSLLTTPSNVLPLHLKPTSPPIIWIFSEGDGIESRLSSWIYFYIIFEVLKFATFGTADFLKLWYIWNWTPCKKTLLGISYQLDNNKRQKFKYCNSKLHNSVDYWWWGLMEFRACWIRQKSSKWS